MDEEYSSIKILNPVKREQFHFIRDTLTRIAEDSGGCVISEEDHSSMEHCNIYVEVRKTNIIGKDLEDFKTALAMSDTFIIVPMNEIAVIIAMGVFDVWQEIGEIE